jgi:hypothetical protein
LTDEQGAAMKPFEGAMELGMVTEMDLLMIFPFSLHFIQEKALNSY